MENLGYSKEEIDLLNEECAELDQNFVLVDEDSDHNPDYVQFQFVGKHEGKEVIYDTLLSTLSMHHSSLLYEAAESKVKEAFKDYIPYEDRDENTPVNEEAEIMMEDIIQEMEDEESIRVSEFIEVDHDFDYGIGIEAALNVDEITVEIIEKFIEDFNNNTLKLDNSVYSFKDED